MWRERLNTYAVPSSAKINHMVRCSNVTNYLHELCFCISINIFLFYIDRFTYIEHVMPVKKGFWLLPFQRDRVKNLSTPENTLTQLSTTACLSERTHWYRVSTETWRVHESSIHCPIAAYQLSEFTLQLVSRVNWKPGAVAERYKRSKQ